MNQLHDSFFGKKYGYYKVGAEICFSSMQAHLLASKNKTGIVWIYHDELFSKIDRALLGKISLDELYRQRAQQLRDTYDYLILNYSGGADSHNVLMSFLNNNIKIDQISVRFPFSAIFKKLHNPNMHIRHASNRNSEWDFTIKPFLDNLAFTHPDIRIELIDWLDKSVLEKLEEDSFLSDPRGGYFLGSMLRSANFAIDKGEREMLDKGKRVANMWGIDKPRLMCTGTETGDRVFMALKDKPMVISSPNISNPNGTEYFYWTPDFPLLAWEMSYKAFQFFNANRHLREIIIKYKNEKHGFGLKKWQRFCDVINTVLYTTWDLNKFQCEKPGFGSAELKSRPGDLIIEQISDLQPYKKKWEHLWNSYDKELDRSISSILPNGEFGAVPTKWHYVGTFD